MPVALGPTDPSACKLRQKTTETWLSRLTEPSRNASATVKYTYLQSNSKDSTKSQSNDAWIHRQAIYSAGTMHTATFSHSTWVSGSPFLKTSFLSEFAVLRYTMHIARLLNPLSYSTGSLTPVTRQLAIRLSKTKSMQQRGEQRPRG